MKQTDIMDNRILQKEMEFLKYILENCEQSFYELRRLNVELQQAMESFGSADINRIGILHRIVQDYLVVRVAGLFDENQKTISFAKRFRVNPIYKQIKQDEIIKYLIKTRHNFVSHNNKRNINGDFFPDTKKILSSNLLQLFIKLNGLLKSL